MAVVEKSMSKPRYVDLPELPETFADSIHSMVWDGSTLRIEFCVTRYPAELTAAAEITRQPAARLVLTAPASKDLAGRLQQTLSAFAKGRGADGTPDSDPAAPAARQKAPTG